MPLSKARNRERMQRVRIVQPVCNLSSDFVCNLEGQSKTVTVQPKLEALRKLIKDVESKPKVVSDIPLYDSMIHKPGDVVRIWRGKQLITVTIPEVDVEGQIIPEWR